MNTFVGKILSQNNSPEIVDAKNSYPGHTYKSVLHKKKVLACHQNIKIIFKEHDTSF